MALRGPQPRPTALHEALGNPSNKKLNKSEPKPKGGPVANRNLSAASLKIWKRIVESMPEGVYTTCDEAILTSYVIAVHVMNKALGDWKAAGEPATIAGSTGQLVTHPLIKVLQEQGRLIATLGTRLGLDPVSRQAINTDQPSSDGDDGVE